MTATQDATIGELQRANAELLRERDAALSEKATLAEALAKRNSEFGERIEQQAATIEVLKAMSATAGDDQPVLDLIARRARELCEAETVGIFSFDGEMISVRCVDAIDMQSLEPYLRTFPRAPARDYTIGRAVLDRQIIEIDDADADSYLAAVVHQHRNRSIITLPFLVDDRVAGGISIAVRKPGGLTDSQKALAHTLAEQAVIAISSAETYRALKIRTTDLQDSLEYQTATSDVLKVISRSTFDLEPVLNALVETAARLCVAEAAHIVTRDGQAYRVAVTFGHNPETDAFVRGLSFSPGRDTVVGRVLLDGQVVHLEDNTDDPEYDVPGAVLRGAYTQLGVPLLREGDPVGVIVLVRFRVEPFTKRQIELVSTFADQAVIAIENTRLITEQREALEQQTATAEVLQVINSSPGNLTPVFDTMLEKAMRLCGAAFGLLNTYDGERLHTAATRGVPAAYADFRATRPPSRQAGGLYDRVLETKRSAHVLDWMEEESYRSGHLNVRAIIDLGGARTALIVPLVKQDAVLGLINIYRQEVRPFSDKQIALLESFAAQAVIAMENARLLGELRERTEALAQRNSEFGERIEQQAATIDVLKVMSASPGDAQPVFELIVERARSFCGADHATTALLRDNMLHLQAYSGMSATYGAVYAAQFPRPVDTSTMFGRAILSRDVMQTGNLQADRDHFARQMHTAAFHSIVGVPLMREGAPLGAIALGRQAAGGFTDSQVALLQTFAEQAVIAITSAETYRALQNRTAELSRSVAELHALEEVLRAVNSSLDLETVLATIINRAVSLSQADEGTIYEFNATEEVFIPKAAFGMAKERVEALRDRRIRIGETPLGNSAAMRAPLHIPDLTQTPDEAGAPELVAAGIHALLAVPLLREDRIVGGLVIRRRAAGGFGSTIPTLLQTFAGQAVLAIENAGLFQEAGRARTTAEAALVDLRRTQDRLVQTEKMASLGQLTAGIAHEIKNPLNFVNNFAALSVDLLSELKETAAPGFEALTDDQRAEIEDVSAMLTSNLEKITEHGKRADGIVKAMLEHSRGSSAERREVDLNALIDEALNLAYHGARAQDQSFNITLERDFAESGALIEVNPQDLTRVFLNIFSNGFYATTRRAREGGEAAFVPTLKVITIDAGDAVEIRVRDNGTGIPADIRDKLFQPFFTTKPTGEGTGLGLSITYDIVTQQHGGSIAVDSKVSDYSEFTVRLPRGS